MSQMQNERQKLIKQAKQQESILKEEIYKSTKLESDITDLKAKLKN